MSEQLIMWSTMTYIERDIYIQNCTFEELSSIKKELSHINKTLNNNIWGSYLIEIDKEIVKRLPGIREDKINEILNNKK